jgi:hypothetical protein
VQYPEVERFFRIDLEAIKTLFAIGDFKDAMKEIMDGLAETFASEFDYTVEVAYLRECAENVTGQFTSRICTSRCQSTRSTRRRRQQWRTRGHRTGYARARS